MHSFSLSFFTSPVRRAAPAAPAFYSKGADDAILFPPGGLCLRPDVGAKPVANGSSSWKMFLPNQSFYHRQQTASDCATVHPQNFQERWNGSHDLDENGTMVSRMQSLLIYRF
jgi:hypothetical protein